MVMFLLSFVKGSNSVEGVPNPLADMDRGSVFASGFGQGGPILGGSKSARTPAPRTEVTQRYRLPCVVIKTNLKLEISSLKRRRGKSKKTRNNQGVIIQYTN